MKFTKLLLLLYVLGVSGPLMAQTIDLQEKISINFADSDLEMALSQLEKAAKINFSYTGDLIPEDKRISELRFENETLEHIIRRLFYPQKVELKISGRRIFILKGPTPKQKFQLNGYIKDAATGEALIGATLMVNQANPLGASTNLYGFYSIALAEGEHQLTISYLGYQPQVMEISIGSDRRLDLSLSPVTNALSEVVVIGKLESDPVKGSKIGYHKLSLDVLDNLPTVIGEADVIKMVQLMPGVQSVGEGSSGLFVRGGGIDQNLILLDEAPVYNPSHALGFFSVFNADAINHAEMYKAGFPVQYGGRLSSVLELRMKEGNKEHLAVTGGIGSLSSRLLIEGPITKGKHSFMLSARRSYPDLFLKFQKDNGGNNIHFYDINAKLNFQFGSNDRLYLSSYFGEDLLRFFDRFENKWGNGTATLRWNHIFNPKFFSNFSLIYSRYNYFIDNIVDQVSTFNWESGIVDYNLKADFNWYWKPNLIINFGVNSIYHQFDPGSERDGRLPQVPTNQALESAAYVGAVHDLGDRWSLEYGLRLNLFQNLGASTLYHFDTQHQLVDSTIHGKGEIYHHFVGLAPRLNIRYLLSDQHSFKFSYSRTHQYQQQLRNSVSGFDAFYIWLPSGPNVPEQMADQLSLGYFRKIKDNQYNLSLEAYYKKLYHQVDYADHARLIQNPYLEGELRMGDGEAYGLEVMLKKNKGRLKGWLSYSYSRTFRTIPEVNNGRTYPAFYDKPHDVSLLLQYEVSKRWELTTNWLYSSGSAVTLPEGSFRIGDAIIPIYPGRNTSRLPDYHRLDLSAKLYRKRRETRKNDAYWLFSIYNIYYRKNALSVTFAPRQEPVTGNIPDPTDIVSTKTYIFGLIPAISYNFKF